MADEDDGQGEGGGGGSKKVIIIIVAVIILIIVGAVVAFFMMKGSEDEVTKVEEKISSSAEPLAAPLFLDLQSRVINLKDGRRYLKTHIKLMMSEPLAHAYLTGRIDEVVDVTISVLKDLSTEDIKQAEAIAELKLKLITEINKLFPKKPAWEDPEPIKKVLFTEFYVQ
ncbi:flagellar basal body-associated FliL family protein [Deltaproteobacteria bacterium TL4]